MIGWKRAMLLSTAGLLATSPAVLAGSSSGTANVAFAGSLELAMDTQLGPSFSRTTGYGYQGDGAGSLGLAREVRAGEISPNVFISVGPGPIALLEPKYTSWAVRVASSPLVVAYNPAGPHAAELEKIAEHKLPIRDLFTLLSTAGFRLGRTDPDTDPQGQAFAMMVQLAQQRLHLPAGTAAKDLGGANRSAEIFPETSLDSQLEAGQLDAASAFLSEAVQLKLPYIALPSDIDFGSPSDSSIYHRASLRLGDGETVHGSLLDIEATVLKGRDPAAARSLVRYLLTAKARATMRRDGYQLLAPKLLGKLSSVPKAIREAATGK